jgi:HEAT repeat protein
LVKDEFSEVFEGKKLGAALVKFLAYENEEVQRAALRLIAEVGQPTSALPYLAILLRKGLERELVLKALKKMARFSPAEVFASLKNWLKRSEVALRAAAAFLLGELASNNVPLLIPLLEDASPEVRREAALALGKSRYSDVPSLLVSLAQDEETVRKAALKGMTIFFRDGWSEDFFELAKTATSPVRALVIETLASRPNEKVLSLLTSLLKDADPFIRSKAALLLRKVKLESKAIVEALMERLGDETPEVKKAAVLALGELGVAEVAPYLINILRQPDATLRLAALSALSKVKDKRAVEAVVNCLKNGAKKEKVAALKALRSIGEEDLAPDLLVFLEDQNDEVFNEALKTLASILKERTTSLFNQLLEKERGERRELIIKALAETRSVRVLPVLFNLLESGHRGDKKAAIEALMSLGESTVIPTLLPFFASEFRPKVFEFAVSMGEVALPGLMLGLSHPDPLVRAWCSYAIGKINAAGSVPILLKALEDSDFRVRQAAAAVLGVLKAESAQNYLLLRSVHDEDRLVRKMAQRALSRLAS